MEQSERKYGRFALPHTFQPEVRFREAVILVMGAITRIFVGSIIFAVCGAYIWYSWATIRNLPLRILAVLGLSIVFLASFGAAMFAIHLAVTAILRRMGKTAQS